MVTWVVPDKELALVVRPPTIDSNGARLRLECPVISQNRLTRRIAEMTFAVSALK
jgi:hypothetical protein